MLRGLREKVTNKVSEKFKEFNDKYDIDWDTSDITRHDVDDIFYPLNMAKQELREAGTMIRGEMGSAINRSRIEAEQSRDAERQTELEAFLAPDQGGEVAASESKASAVLFEYDALPDGPLQTRILILRGGPDFGRIECRLETVSLDDPRLRYEALSYCWGAQEGRTPIYCNGRRLDVTRNLKMALNNLRPEQGERTLWVDAICINQNDKPECARQVLKMGDIYGRATGVVVWIGETCADYRVSFAVLAHLSKLYEDAEGRPMQYEDMKNGAARIAIEGYRVKLSFMQALRLVQVMEQAEWFARVWVLQEVALAQSVSVVCGRQALSWDAFEKGMLVRALVATRDRKSRVMLSRRFDVRVLKVIELRMALVNAKQDRSILHLLNQFRGQRASLAADKAYGILSMTDTDVNDIGLRIDYSIPTAQLYTELARGILRNAAAGGLGLLSVPRADSKLSEEMPSWVPDWSDATGGARPLLASVSRYGNGKFSASGELAPADSTPCDFAGAQLILRGYMLDRIERISTDAFTDAEPLLKPPSAQEEGDDTYSTSYVYEQIEQAESHYKPIKTSWKNFLENPPALPISSTKGSMGGRWSWLMRKMTYPPTSEMLGTAYVRTLCADSFPPFVQLDEATYNLLISALEMWSMDDVNPHGMWNVLQRLSKLEVDGDRVRRGLPPVEFPHSFPRLVDFGGMMDVMLGRRLMWSRDTYFGAVPAAAKEGDAIVLVKGCRVPLVLRPKAGAEEKESTGQQLGRTEWQLIGDCFLHGAMYGERWREELCEEVVLV